MKKGAKKKGGAKAGSKGASTSSASKNDDAIVETGEAATQETKPTQEADEAAKVESPVAKEGKNEEEAKENPEKEDEQAEPDSSTPQEKDKNASQTDEAAKGASSSQPRAEAKKEEDEKPVRRGKRKRSTKKEGNTSVTRAKRAKATKPQEAEPEYFKEKRSLEDLWKAAFPVGTEWGQLDELYEFNWNFTNVEAALDEGGQLYGKKVYVFGCTESQVVPYNNENKTVLVPTVVCIQSSIPPSDKIGVASVNSEAEEIIPMKDMKMAWVPYVPLEKRDRPVDRMNFQISILGCTQRRSALKHLKEDRVKKFNHCLPYINNPYKEDESEKSTVVQITFPSEPPLVRDYDWEKNNLEDFTNDLIVDQALLMDKKDEFMEFVAGQCESAQKTNEEAKQARDKAKEEMSEGTKEAYQQMRLYKFYPLPSPDTPDLSGIDKTSFINKYFGKAHEVI